MTGMDSYDNRLDEEIGAVFRSAVAAAETTRLNRVSMAGLISHLLHQNSEIFEPLWQSLKIQPAVFHRQLKSRINSTKTYPGQGVRIDEEVTGTFRHALARAKSHFREKITIEDIIAVLGHNMPGTFMTILIELGADPYDVSINVVDLLKARTLSQTPAPLAVENETYPFKPGQIVRITGGPFAAMPARVEAVDIENSEVTARVEVFGKSTSITLPLSQVQKISFT